MGITIYLHIDFNKITQAQWESVYDETLELIKRYPFMDEIVDETNYAEPFVYADRTRERYLTPWYPDLIGWFTIGDLKTFEYAESFMLIKDINFYKDDEGSLKTGDIYFSLINRYDEIDAEIGSINTSETQVFDGKTQGYDYHKYLLGIACLIEDRLNPHAVVSGDITRAQIQTSIKWVNKNIEKKITLPDRCNFNSLLLRIKKHLKTENAQIEALFELLLYPNNKELGDFIRDTFTHDTIIEYWTRYLRDNKPNTYGMNRAIKTYLDMHFSIADLCDILVLKDNGKFMDVKTCITTILKSGILEKEPQQNILSWNDQTDPEPETIPSVFGKSYLAMVGYRDSTTNFMDERDLKEVLYATFRQNNLVDETIAEYKNNAAKDDLEDSINEMMKKIVGNTPDGPDNEISENYDIERASDIIYWKEGDSLHPVLEKNIRNILDFSDNVIKDIKDDFPDCNENMRINVLIECNTYYLLSKETWDFIRDNILDDRIFFKILSLLYIKADEITINSIMESALNNLDFLKQYVLK